MSPIKKILFLCLTLIILIVLCVNTHLEQLSRTTNNQVVQEDKELKLSIATKKLEEPKTSPSKEIQTSEIVKKDKNKETIKEEAKTTDKKVEKKTTNKNGEPEEGEPLITTDKRYKRTGNEKPIEQMSINTQLLQIRIRDYVAKYPITFETSSNKITKKSLNTISTVVKILKNYPNIKIEVAGHTDAAGSKKYNLGVSVNRAVEVKKQMIAYGFDKHKVKARGYGESIPIVENSTKGYSKINRRVEFNIIEE